jgi:hypothetical protein
LHDPWYGKVLGGKDASSKASRADAWCKWQPSVTAGAHEEAMHDVSAIVPTVVSDIDQFSFSLEDVDVQVGLSKPDSGAVPEKEKDTEPEDSAPPSSTVEAVEALPAPAGWGDEPEDAAPPRSTVEARESLPAPAGWGDEPEDAAPPRSTVEAVESLPAPAGWRDEPEDAAPRSTVEAVESLPAPAGWGDFDLDDAFDQDEGAAKTPAPGPEETSSHMNGGGDVAPAEPTSTSNCESTSSWVDLTDEHRGTLPEGQGDSPHSGTAAPAQTTSPEELSVEAVPPPEKKETVGDDVQTAEEAAEWAELEEEARQGLDSAGTAVDSPEAIPEEEIGSVVAAEVKEPEETIPATVFLQ